MELAAHGSVFNVGKPYVARIVGTDPTFGLAREFLAGYRDASNSGRTWWYRVDVTQPGLYEVQHSGRKGPKREYYVVRVGDDGKLVGEPIEREKAIEMARGM